MGAYKRIEMYSGNITDAYIMMYEHKKKTREDCEIDFNGKIINSDMSEDECYMTILSKTRRQVLDEEKAWLENYRREEEEHKNNISNICAQYEKDAVGRIDEDDMDYFKQILPIRVSDLYHGIEIKSLFDIIDVLNTNGVADAVKTFDNQGHSGMSAGLVANLVKRFHKKLGNEFYEEAYAKFR